MKVQSTSCTYALAFARGTKAVQYNKFNCESVRSTLLFFRLEETMALVKPFKAIRPALDLADKIAALPYDVYSRKEAAEEVKDKPYSFLRIDRAETTLGDEVDTYDPCVYEKAKEIYEDFKAKKYYIKEEKEAYYIYELTMKGRTQTGLVICASIDDYINGVILKHENTREDKEIDRINHVDVMSAQTGPIFLAYRVNSVINGIIAKNKKKESMYSFESEDGIRHEAWIIDDANDIADITKAFETVSNLYIADGHHRSASAVKVGLKRRAANPDYKGGEEFNFFLSVIFPDEELMIMDYNRLLKDLNGYDAEAFLKEVEKKFIVEKCDGQYRPESKGNLGMFLMDTWYKLTVRDEFKSADPVEGLDVSILQNELLKPVLGINDPKTDGRIDFIGGIKGLDELERRVKTDGAVAFAMYPTAIHELFKVADAGLLMPPKSTWFEPKLRSGLFIHEF